MSDRINEQIYEFYLRNIVHMMKRIQDEKLVPYDITNQQARLLGDINQQLEQGNDFCQKDLEKAMKLRGSSITSLLQGLERKGFITRIQGDQDGRTKQLCVASKGRALIDEMETVFREMEYELVEGMSNEEKELFKKFLQISYNNLRSKSN